MAYLKLNGNDYSMYVTKLKVGTQHFYTQKSSANGADRITYKYSRKAIEVGIIPLEDDVMKRLLTDINGFSVTVDYRDPTTNKLTEGLTCIVPEHLVEYYTIQSNKVMYQAFSFQLEEINKIGEVN